MTRPSRARAAWRGRRRPRPEGAAEWIIEGEPSLDLACWDVARFGPWAGKRYTRARTRYFYENRSARSYPYQQYDAGRPLGRRLAATLSAEPRFDPKGERLKG